MYYTLGSPSKQKQVLVAVIYKAWLLLEEHTRMIYIDVRFLCVCTYPKQV
jgi:hypothetical protein